MLGIKGWRMVTEVLVPGAMPMIFTGLRLSLQASWTTLVAAELIGALYGLGSISEPSRSRHFPCHDSSSHGICWHMRCLILLGLLGALENHAMPWRKGRVAT